MLDIAIKGSCATRECFNYQKPLFNEELFKVSNYIFRKPLAVIESDQLLNANQNLIDKLKVELINRESVQDFLINQVTNSFTKEFIRDVHDHEKFFIMDFIDEKLNLIKIEDSFIEYRREFIPVLEREQVKFEIIQNNKDFFYQYIDSFINSVKEKYPEENIILHKVFALNTTRIDNEVFPLTSVFANPLNKSRINTYSITKITRVNLFLTEIYDYIEKNHPNIKIIELPIKEYYSPTNHRYNVGLHHYNDQYYYDFLEKLKEITSDKNATKNERVAEENKLHIHELQQKSIIINNIYETRKRPMFPGNPEELLFRPLNSPINYDLKNGGKPILKSYQLKDSTQGIMVYDQHGKIKAKLLLNNINEVERVYTFHNNEILESITIIDKENGSTTSIFDNNKNNVTSSGKVDTIKRESDNIYSVFNPNNQLILKKIDLIKAKQSRILFYQNNKLNMALFFINDKISKINRYDRAGRIFEEFSMGEFIHIGKIQVKFRYNQNKKKIRYIFHATGDLKTRTLFSENERYLKIEAYDKYRKIRKEIHFNDKGKKIRVVDFSSQDKRKVYEYSDYGNRSAVSFYQGEELIKRSVRDNDSELFQDLYLAKI